MSEIQQTFRFEKKGSQDRRDAVLVLALIRKQRGRANATPMQQLAQLTMINTRRIQAIVKWLVEEKHLPIGSAMSAPFGYYWIATEDERRENRNHFLRRALSNLSHARAYDSAAIVAPLIGQLELELGGER